MARSLPSWPRHPPIDGEPANPAKRLSDDSTFWKGDFLMRSDADLGVKAKARAGSPADDSGSPMKSHGAATTGRWPVWSRSIGFAGITAAMIAILAAAGAPTPLLPIYEKRWGFPSWEL